MDNIKVFIEFEGTSKRGYDWRILITNKYRLTNNNEYNTSSGTHDKFFSSVDEAEAYITKFAPQKIIIESEIQ